MAQLGVSGVLKILLSKGINVNAEGGNCGSALSAESYGGHEEMVRLLLEKEAKVNAKVGFSGNALKAASYRGHETVVRLLVEKGANLNAQGLRGRADRGIR